MCKFFVEFLSWIRKKKQTIGLYEFILLINSRNVVGDSHTVSGVADGDAVLTVTVLSIRLSAGFDEGQQHCCRVDRVADRTLGQEVSTSGQKELSCGVEDNFVHGFHRNRVALTS